MKHFFTFLFIAFLAVPGREAMAVEDSPYVPKGFVFGWGDEFDGSAVNETKWNYRPDAKGRPDIAHRKENIRIEDGALKIDLLVGPVEMPGGTVKPTSGGGVISKKGFRQGYFEVRAKMPATVGWHPSWWTVWNDGYNVENNPGFPWVEIDVFERSGPMPANEMGFNMPIHPKGRPNQPIYTAHRKFPFDLSKDYHIYGLEICGDFIVLYFDGEIMSLAFDNPDLARHVLPDHIHHMWLTCTALGILPIQSDAMYVDYIRRYTTDVEGYLAREKEFQKIRRDWEERERQVRSRFASRGTDLWIEPVRFDHLGLWNVASDYDEDYPFILTPILFGQQDRDRESTDGERSAIGKVVIPQSGNYRLWVRCRDFATKTPGIRFFDVSVNGRKSTTTFGTHGQEGFAWQDGGVFDLEEGEAEIVIFDTSKWYVRLDQILLTSDLGYIPESIGGMENAEYR
ncbi:glycoside hydrolase family 16 protein [bacterium]|nr:glycoside hydrolase family 16 protein [bacterium]